MKIDVSLSPDIIKLPLTRKPGLMRNIRKGDIFLNPAGQR